MENPQGRLEVVDAEGVTFGTSRAQPSGRRRSSPPAAEGHDQEAPAVLRSPSSRRCRPTSRADVSGITVSSADLFTFTLGQASVVWGSGATRARKVAILTALLKTRPKVIDVSAPDTPVTR